MMSSISHLYTQVDTRKTLLRKCCDSQKTLFSHDWSEKKQSSNQRYVEKYRTICEAECEEVKAMTKLLAKADRTLMLLKQKSESKLLMRKMMKKHMHKCDSVDIKEKPSSSHSERLQTTIQRSHSDNSIDKISDNLQAAQIHDIGAECASHESGPTTNIAESLNEPSISDEIHEWSAPKLTENHSTGVISQSKLSRLISGTRASSDRRYKPAHTTAPYKTDPIAKRPSLPCFPKRSKHTSSNVQRTAILKSKETHRKSRPPSASSVGDRNNSAKTGVPDSQDSSPITAIAIDECNVQDVFSDAKEQSDHLDLKDEHLVTDEVITASIASIEENMNKRAKEDAAATTFSLEKHGHSLVVPPKLRQVSSKNKKLGQACAQMADEMSQESSESCSKFMQLFYNCMPTDCATIFRRRVDLNSQSYHTLTRILQDLKLANLSDVSSMMEVCRARVFLEYILKTFQELNEETRLLLEEYKLKGYEKTLDQINCEKSEPSFCVFDEFPDTSLHIRYSKERHLHQYWDLWHKYHILRIRLHIIDLIEREYLPILRDSQGSDKFIPIYRSLYSLLCSRKPTFPTFIKDTSESDEDPQHVNTQQT